MSNDAPEELVIQSSEPVFVINGLKVSNKGYLLPFLSYLVCGVVASGLHEIFQLPPPFVVLIFWLGVIPSILYITAGIGSGERNIFVVKSSGLKFGWQGKKTFLKRGAFSSPPIEDMRSISFLRTGNKDEEIVRMVFFVRFFDFVNILNCLVLLLFVSKMGFRNAKGGLFFDLAFNSEVLGHWNDKGRLVRALQALSPDLQLVGYDPESKSELSVTSLWLEDFQRGETTSGSLHQDSFLKDGAFQIVRKVVTGGQANIYEATLVRNNQSCILKEFILPRGTKEAVQGRIAAHVEEEVALLQKLEDDRIVKLEDYFVDRQRIYFALKKIEGATLRQIVTEQGPLKPERVTDLLMQMSGILSYLHSQSPPVVHRDFTPDNLMLDTDGKLIVIDFSVAQELESKATRTFVGKNNYVPPEQFRGKANEQSDFYAMGATTYFLLTGKDPEALSCSTPPPAAGAKLCAAVSALTALQLKDRVSTAEQLAALL